MIDSAAWTGRTGAWNKAVSMNCLGLLLLLIWQERDARGGQRLPVYGIQLGIHWHVDCRGVTLYWGMTEWRWLRPRCREF